VAQTIKHMIPEEMHQPESVRHSLAGFTLRCFGGAQAVLAFKSYRDRILNHAHRKIKCKPEEK
jgi:hypothetical protein